MEAPPPDEANGPARTVGVGIARSDLASRLGVELQDIDLVSVEEVTWRDGSLGCAQPGMRYRQVTINGQRIALGYGDAIYFYHSGGGRGPFLCTDPTGPGPLGGRHGPV